MEQINKYIEWCIKKGLKPNRAGNLDKFLSHHKEKMIGWV